MTLAQPFILRLSVVLYVCVPTSFQFATSDPGSCQLSFEDYGVILSQQKASYLSSFSQTALEELSFCVYKWVIVSDVEALPWHLPLQWSDIGGVQ